MSVVIITGASRGLGASTAMQVASRGMGVILTYNSHAAGAQDVVQRIGAPDDVGHVIAHLLSPDNGWINAQNIEVAGGYNI